MGQSIKELQEENNLLRQELRTAREAAEITARLVVKQFERTEHMIHRFQAANAQRKAVLSAATQLAIIATDLEGTITLFNRGAVNLLGFSESEMVGKRNISCIHLKDELKRYAREITGVTPDDYDAIRVFDLHVKQHIFKTVGWTYIRKNGTHLPVNLSITSFYNARGILKGYLFTAMDMTSHKKMEQELTLAMENAEAANASKGDFLARMSHEIRTPMNGILGMAHLMEKTRLNDKQSNYLDKIIVSANILLNLINDILDFSKIEAGKLTLESIDFDLNDVLDNLTGTIGLQAEKKGLEFLFDIDQDVPFKLLGDPLRLGQILMNLAGNAIKFTEKGEIVISVTIDHGKRHHHHGLDIPVNIDKRQKDAGGVSCDIDKSKGLQNDTYPENHEVTLKFSVKDSGIGLYPEQVDYLFKAFSQADDTITRKYGGTGLGLSICRQLAGMMKGEIWVESSPGHGSTFIFTVKLKCSKQTENPSLPCGDDILKGRRALVVDDNKAARELLASILDCFHMEVDDAPDGKTALKYLESAIENKMPYDVVLLDWIMPGMDGIETARRIKSNTAMTDIPAMLMVTANGREDARVKAEEAGIDAFLLKPVYSSVIYNTLLQILGIECQFRERGHATGKHVKIPDAIKKIQKTRILLVEDNAINQEIAVELLQDAGMAVKIANNGKECLDIIEKDKFDLVLMDIQMPVMDGLEATRIIRNEKKLTDLPIIAMTAHAMAGDREKSLDAGMNDHLNKPVNPEALYETLQKFIPAKKSRTAGTGALKNIMPLVSESTHDTLISGDFQFSLPPLKGINMPEALKRMNNNPDLLFSFLNNFKKDYADMPAAIRELFNEKKFGEIRIHAHNIKGLSAYMGADTLVKAAADLETCMKELEQQVKNQNIPDCRCRDIDEKSISLFIDEMEKILIILDHLPFYRRKKESGNKKKSQVSPLLDKNSDNLYLNKEEQKLLQDFMISLDKGELSSMDLLPDVEQILTKCGREKELKIIIELMDDIEYEEAAETIGDLLKQIS